MSLCVDGVFVCFAALTLWLGLVLQSYDVTIYISFRAVKLVSGP